MFRVQSRLSLSMAMVTYLCRWEHKITVKHLIKEGLLNFLSYDDLLRSKTVPLGTYVFTDMDRLSPWELELAAIAYRTLKQAGAHVLNDPAQVRTRYDLLNALHQEGLNSFAAYRPSLGEWPERYPVFVRRDHFHSGVLSELLQDRKALVKALASLADEGIPHSNLIAVEYCAQPLDGGIYRKEAVYRIGDRYARCLNVHEKQWAAKYGSLGCANDEMYEEEFRNMDQIPYLDAIKQVFDFARIDYGRVDFGVVDGRPQFYEVNTNPTVGNPQLDHPNPHRVKSHQHFMQNYRLAMKELDTPPSGAAIKFDHPELFKLRRRTKSRFCRYRSLPTI